EVEPPNFDATAAACLVPSPGPRPASLGRRRPRPTSADGGSAAGHPAPKGLAQVAHPGGLRVLVPAHGDDGEAGRRRPRRRPVPHPRPVSHAPHFHRLTPPLQSARGSAPRPDRSGARRAVSEPRAVTPAEPALPSDL